MSTAGKDFATKVLVADDSAFMRQYLIGFLHECGIVHIEEAGNGQIALQIYQTQKPDVVLLDLIMPIEGGSDVLEKLVALGAKVIIVSAVGQEKVIQEMLKKGAKGYFIKPFFSAKEIGDKIQSITSGETT